MSRKIVLGLAVLCMSFPMDTAQAEVVDFQDLTVPSGYNYYNGSPTSDSFASGSPQATFNNYYVGDPSDPTNPTLAYWAGWSYANTPLAPSASIGGPGDYIYQYDAAATSGAGQPSTYAMGYYDPYDTVIPTVTLPVGEHPVSVQVTNSTFTALAVQYYDGYTPTYSAATGDWFQLSITGYDSANHLIGSIPFDLADFSSTDKGTPYVVQNWTNVNLGPLYDAHTLQFTMTYGNANGTIQDPINILTPTYVAIANLSLTKQPGDANDDGIVNSQDLAQIAANWQKSGPVGDVNGDGIINAQDLALVAANWMATPGSGSSDAQHAAAVPEPATAALAALGMALVMLIMKAR